MVVTMDSDGNEVPELMWHGVVVHLVGGGEIGICLGGDVDHGDMVMLVGIDIASNLQPQSRRTMLARTHRSQMAQSLADVLSSWIKQQLLGRRAECSSSASPRSSFSFILISTHRCPYQHSSSSSMSIYHSVISSSAE
ncbi:hypothetical protein Tco_0790960 [Tanacetum coccineum]